MCPPLEYQRGMTFYAKIFFQIYFEKVLKFCMTIWMFQIAGLLLTSVMVWLLNDFILVSKLTSFVFFWVADRLMCLCRVVLCIFFYIFGMCLWLALKCSRFNHSFNAVNTKTSSIKPYKSIFILSLHANKACN